MSLNEKLKNLFGNKDLSRKQIDAFLETEEGQDLIVSKIQKAMPSFLEEVNSTSLKEQKTEPINPKIDDNDIFEDRPKENK